MAKRRKNRTSSAHGVIIRALSALLLLIITAAALLYAAGYYDLSFLHRYTTITGSGMTGGAVENKTLSKEYAEKYLEQLLASNNIRGVGSAGAFVASNAAKLDAKPFSELSEKGAEITFARWDDTMRFGELTLKKAPANKLIAGEMTVRGFFSATEGEDEIPFTVEKRIAAERHGVELYMGYICVANGGKISVYDADGYICELSAKDFLPAYTRDREDRPLFFANDGFSSYSYLDRASGKLLPSDYDDDIDGRGLYFDYVPAFGANDGSRSILSAVLSVNDEISVLVTEKSDGEETTAPKKTESGTTKSVTDTAPPEETTKKDKETTTAAPKETETDFPPDTTYQNDEDNWIDEDGDGINDNEQIEVYAPVADFEIRLLSDMPETDPPPETEMLTVTRRERRFALADNDGRTITGYNFTSLFNFSEGFCAAENYDGSLRFLRPNGRTAFDGDGKRRNQLGRYVTTQYMLPVIPDISSVGSCYFDGGLVRVRRVETDSYYKDKVTGEYDILVYADGSEFEIPSGYTLRAYSSGVLLLEREGLYGYYSSNGYWIAQPIYTYARPFAEGIGVIGFSSSIKGAVDCEGNIVIPFAYDYISQVSSGTIALYSAKDGWKVIVKCTMHNS